MSKKKEKQRKEHEAREQLLKRLKEGMTLYTNLRHVSQSGMTRYISPVAIIDNEPINLSYWVNDLFGYRQAEKFGTQCVKVGGCGMDMGFHLIYSLSSILFHDGYALQHRWL